MARKTNNATTKQEVERIHLAYGDETEMDDLIAEYSQMGKVSKPEPISKENTRVTSQNHWVVDYHAFRLDIACFLSDNEMSQKDLDTILGFENMVSSMCRPNSEYETGKQDLLMGNFLLLCTALELDPRNYFTVQVTTNTNKPVARGRGKSK